jgi:hypothetical protein
MPILIDFKTFCSWCATFMLWGPAIVICLWLLPLTLSLPM